MLQIGTLIVECTRKGMTFKFTTQTEYNAIVNFMGRPPTENMAVDGTEYALIKLYNSPVVYSDTHEVEIDNTIGDMKRDFVQLVKEVCAEFHCLYIGLSPAGNSGAVNTEIEVTLRNAANSVLCPLSASELIGVYMASPSLSQCVCSTENRDFDRDDLHLAEVIHNHLLDLVEDQALEDLGGKLEKRSNPFHRLRDSRLSDC